MHTSLAALAAAVAIAFPGAGLADISLVMVEEDGCIWCARWDAEVGDAYAKTELGRRAPLRRIDIRDPLPDDLEFASPPRLTPTFVLVDDGQELHRIEGYPGEHFFWPMLERMLTEAAPSGPDGDTAHGAPLTEEATP
ncbi:hypothetical protein ROJ8625_01522 [Roseivivax jejudonensis]|uniref:Regulatory protein SoxS n=1 Tax=Roseivivax jejudonensis TaxID=1529041 RepID=A0A1X6YWI3_9RHOB|nr:hypothetical protein [Roseivivax jejudonensis]SLN32711.1 hypothetical protein ROJ8625_01522 [Roseivivax jejudonensis]